MAKALRYNEGQTVREHWESSVNYAKLGEVSEFTRSKISVEVMKIIFNAASMQQGSGWS